jgi:hypothetical protein
VEVHLGSPGALKRRVESSGVVVVAMADRHCLYPFEMDPKLAYVLVEHLALSGIEEQFPAVRVNPETKSMFPQQPRPTDRVFREDDNLQPAHCPGLCALAHLLSAWSGDEHTLIILRSHREPRQGECMLKKSRREATTTSRFPGSSDEACTFSCPMWTPRR